MWGERWGEGDGHEIYVGGEEKKMGSGEGRTKGAERGGERDR